MLCSGKADPIAAEVTFVPNNARNVGVAEPNPTIVQGWYQHTATAKKRTALASKNWKTFKRPASVMHIIADSHAPLREFARVRSTAREAIEIQKNVGVATTPATDLVLKRVRVQRAVWGSASPMLPFKYAPRATKVRHGHVARACR
jgi:hypothetical protein